MSMYILTTDEKIVEVEEPLVGLSGRLREAREEAAAAAAGAESANQCALGASPSRPLTGLENVDSGSLEAVLRWLRHHLKHDDQIEENSQSEPEDNLARRIKGRRTKEFRWKRRYMYVPKFDREFLSALDNPTLIGVVNAAHQLRVKRLMEYACRAVADSMKNKTVEELREQFGIENDWSDYEDDEEKKTAGEDITLLSIDRSRTANFKWKCTGP